MKSEHPVWAMRPAWVLCECGDYRCLIHGMHAHDCTCPPVEEWEISPYRDFRHVVEAD